MNKLSILLLICFLSEGSVNAARVEPDVSFGPSGSSNYVVNMSKAELSNAKNCKTPEKPMTEEFKNIQYISYLK
jgi:hypothetical protein